MSQYTYNNETINIPKGKCHNGLPVNRMSEEELAANGYVRYIPETVEVEPYVPSIEERIQQLDQACRGHIDKSAHWTAAPMIWDKAKGGKPKSLAVKACMETCWNQFYTNAAHLEGGAPWDDAMLVYPDVPYSMQEAMME